MRSIFSFVASIDLWFVCASERAWSALLAARLAAASASRADRLVPSNVDRMLACSDDKRLT
jgi:hypothetical protein